MNIKSILVSQPEPKSESSPYKSLIENQNVRIDFRPFVHIEAVSAGQVIKQKVDLSKFDAVILTSRNAVDHYFRVAEGVRFQVPDTMKYFCQSEAVAYYLQKYMVYRKRKIYVASRSFADLLDLLKKYKSLKFLLPSSDKLKTEVPALLDKARIKWQRAILYRTVCSDLSDLKDVYYDVLVFFSPSGIKSLFENFPDFEQNDTRIAVYGKSTIAAAQAAGLQVQIEAPTPETPSMATALQHYIQTENKVRK